MVNIRLSGLFFLLIFPILTIQAQNPPLLSKDYWHQGQVQLSSGKILLGHIKYQFEDNIIMFKKTEENIEIFSSFQLKSFNLIDVLTKTERRFYTLPVELPKLKERFAYFELVQEGTISLLSQEKIILQNSNQLGQHKWLKPGYYAVEDEYYLLNEQGKLEKYKNISQLSAFLQEDKKYLQDLVAGYQINLATQKGFSFLLKQYNQVLALRKLPNPNKEGNNNAGGF